MLRRSLILFFFFLVGCTTPSYTSIPMQEAQAKFEEEKTYILLDVRTQEEYQQGHIPGSICIPNEHIEEHLDALPNKDQCIFVYCRSGNRSKQAAEKLVKAGYTNVIEIGGILDWDGEIDAK